MTATTLIDASCAELEPPVIDEDHLARMTLGDLNLEREVLEIFARQTALMLGRIANTSPALAAAAAHTLTGSARGIGAWRVAQAAERLEYVARRAGGQGLGQAIEALTAAAAEANAAIAARLAAGSPDP